MEQCEQYGKHHPQSTMNIAYFVQIFIDQPTTTGFSYTIPIPAYEDDNGDIIELPDENCPDYAQAYGTCGTYSKSDIALVPNSTARAAPNMWKTLQGFMGAFPQYSRNGFNFATESYGGHYGPVFNGKSVGSSHMKVMLTLGQSTSRSKTPKTSLGQPRSALKTSLSVMAGSTL